MAKRSSLRAPEFGAVRKISTPEPFIMKRDPRHTEGLSLEQNLSRSVSTYRPNKSSVRPDIVFLKNDRFIENNGEPEYDTFPSTSSYTSSRHDRKLRDQNSYETNLSNEDISPGSRHFQYFHSPGSNLQHTHKIRELVKRPVTQTISTPIPAAITHSLNVSSKVSSNRNSPTLSTDQIANSNCHSQEPLSLNSRASSLSASTSEVCVHFYFPSKVTMKI